MLHPGCGPGGVTVTWGKLSFIHLMTENHSLVDFHIAHKLMPEHEKLTYMSSEIISKYPDAFIVHCFKSVSHSFMLNMSTLTAKHLDCLAVTFGN